MDQKELTQLLFSFNGRINRKKYFLSAIGVTFYCLAINDIFSPSFEKIDEDLTFVVNFGFFVYLYLAILCVCAWIALDVKRLHDLNKSAWFCLFGLIPYTIITILDINAPDALPNRLQALYWGSCVIGLIYYIILLFTKGTEGENQFGEDPLADRDYLNYLK